MNFIKFKEDYFNKYIQCIQLDLGGNVLFSSNNILKIPEGCNLKNKNPFIESILIMLDGLDPETIFSCVEITHENKTLLTDITVIKKAQGIILVISDFTTHYTHSNVLIQERNDSVIKKNKLKYEKELLEEKENLKNNFLAKLNHELRNPLSNMLGVLTLLANSGVDKDQSKLYAIAIKTGWHLEEVLNDLLDISMINEGKLTLNHIPFRIRQIATYMVELFRLKREKGVLKFEVSVAHNMPRVLIGDPTRVKQILVNLLENAFKHTHCGKVTLTISEEDNNASSEEVLIKFVIKDTGIGIKEAEIQKIFKEYYQIENFLSESEGQGLGLKIVKDLVTLQHGTIHVDSVYGEGTTFTVKIPFKKYNPESSAKKKYKTKKSSFSKYQNTPCRRFGNWPNDPG